MAGNILSMDTQFPTSTGDAEKDLKKVYGYLYTLLEGLRYTLANIGRNNFNDTAFREISQEITDTITFSVSRDGKDAVLTMKAGEITLSSERIELDGMVTFSELGDDQNTTIINGATITTGTVNSMTINASTMNSGTINASTFNSMLKANKNQSDGNYNLLYKPGNTANRIGGIYLDDRGAGTADNNKYRMIIETTETSPRFAIKIVASGDISIESDRDIYIGKANNNRDIQLNGNVYINGTQITPT